MLNILIFLYAACAVSLLILLIFQAGRSNELSLLGGGVNSAIKSSGGKDFISTLTSYLAFGFIFFALVLTYSFLGKKEAKVESHDKVDQYLLDQISGVPAKNRKS